MTDPRYMREGVDFALGKVTEEIGEFLAEMAAIQSRMAVVLFAVGKTQRWGLKSVNPELPPEEQETNEEMLFTSTAELYVYLMDRFEDLVTEKKDVMDALQNLAKEIAVANGEVTREEWDAAREVMGHA